MLAEEDFKWKVVLKNVMTVMTVDSHDSHDSPMVHSGNPGFDSRVSRAGASSLSSETFRHDGD